ncbi:hypothetical protein ACI3L3_11180 [Desulfobaculum sp. SPO524]|uniref:hypothetical protein n=1 Tax=Desulfobaculum sp. SPO524 TaxID=3378071 RepID=UPI0038530572
MPLAASILITIVVGYQLGVIAGGVFFVVTCIGNQIFFRIALEKGEEGKSFGSPWVHQIVTWIIAWFIAAALSGSISIGQA